MNKIKTLLSFIVLAVTLPLGAQSFHESLFLSNYRLGYRYNPAIQSDTDFISIGEFTNYAANNVGASAFLFPRNGELVTGLHPDVFIYDFMTPLKTINAFQDHLNYSIFAYGFRAGESFHTVELSARGMSGMSVPKEFFRFLKLGGEGLFPLGGTRMQGKLFAELAYGYSRKIGDQLTLGARAKLLVGLYSADFNIRQFDLQVNGESYHAETDAQLDLTSHAAKLVTNEDGYLQLLKWRTRDRWVLPSGAGLAVDLGFLWEPAEGLKISASVTDLGGLFWYYGNAGNSAGSYTFTGLSLGGYEDLNFQGLLTQAKELGEQLLNAASFKADNRRIVFDALPFQVNAGIRYSMPFYRALSVGVTGNYSAFQGLPYWEGRFVTAVNPLNWLDLCGSIGYGTYGLTWGAALQFRILRFRVHAGIQDGFGGTIPYTSIPLEANGKTLVIGLTYDI